jgi:NTP pyrophosphatase (non-canonical NTP hydrolase)
LNFNEYQKFIDEVRLPSASSFEYALLGFIGEVGEVYGLLAKNIRDNNGDYNDEVVTKLKKELGDTLWFMAAIANDLDLKLEDIAQENIHKLISRKTRGVLQGSGDER